MKNLLEKYQAAKNEFDALRWETEKAFSEFLESIPEWRDIIGSVTNEDPDYLIPEVKDIEISGSQISFRIRVSRDWSPTYIKTDWFPLDYLTGKYIDPDYLRAKLDKKLDLLKEYQKEEDQIMSCIKEIETEIGKLKKLLGD